MAIVKFTNSQGSVRFILRYVMDKNKTEESLISGLNCVAENAYAEMTNVKELFHKTDGRQYVHIVQSFHPDEELTSEKTHEIGMKFAEYFKGFQAVVVTHQNTDHLHNHIVLNSVNFETGRKFHQSIPELDMVKEFSNRLCRECGLQETPIRLDKDTISRGEYNAAMKAESWKFQLIKAIDEALERSVTKQDFIANMEFEGYGVKWMDSRKNITFTTPDGKKCRDNKLHDVTYLKDNLDLILQHRQEFGFEPMTQEPKMGWLNQVKKERGMPLDEPISTEHSSDSPTTTDPETLLSHRKKKRETIKAIANKHQLPSEMEQEMNWN